jgi:iron complex outermembrane receptor protein
MKRGIKPGGFSTPIAPLENDQMRYKDEKLDALEGGVKSDLLDKRLRLNISAYHYWYKDYQAVQFAGTGTYTTNADARVSGVDAEIVWAPLWSTEFGVNGGYLDGVAKNISLSTPSGVLTRDRQLPNAPKVSLNAYGRYRFNLAGGELSLRVDSILRSKTYFEIQNSPALSQGEYGVVDLSAGWQRGDWSVSATASNVLDRHYYAFLQDGSDFGLLQGTQGRPRWLSVQVTKRW